MLTKDSLHAAAKALADRQGIEPDSWLDFADRAREAGWLWPIKSNGQITEWTVLDDETWWLIAVPFGFEPPTVEAGPFGTKREAMEAARLETTDYRKSGLYVEPVEVRGPMAHAARYIARQDVAEEKGWVAQRRELSAA